MAGGEAALLEMIDALRSIDTDMPAGTVAESVPLVLAEAQRTARAGTTPDGVAWPAKKGGGQALVHAADAVRARALGSVIEVSLAGTSSGDTQAQAVQNYGTGRIPARQIIPAGGDGRIPAGYAAAIAEGARRAFRKIVGAGA